MGYESRKIRVQVIPFDGETMTAEFTKLKCPSCNKRLKVPAGRSIKKIKCPKCDLVFRHSLKHQVQPRHLQSAGQQQLDQPLVKGEVADQLFSDQQNRPQSTDILTSAPPPSHDDIIVATLVEPGPTEHLTDSIEALLTDQSENEPKPSKRVPSKRVPAKQVTTKRPVRKTSRLTTKEQLGGCLAVGKKNKALIDEHSKSGRDAISHLSIALLSILCAFIAGLITLEIFRMKEDFMSLGLQQKTIVISVYAGYFLVFMLGIRLLIHRAAIGLGQQEIEARQSGIRIVQRGRTKLIPYVRLKKVFFQPPSDLSQLIGSLLIGQNRTRNRTLVFETTRGRKIRIKCGELVFTPQSLAAAIEIVERKIDEQNQQTNSKTN